MSGPYADTDGSGGQIRESKRANLGNVRLRDVHTNEIILIPKPSNDPNDPLNWSQAYKYYIATVVCLAMLVCNFLAAGPTVAIVETAVEFFPTDDIDLSVSRVAYFFTSTALVQGTGNFLWVPLTNKFGRRPVYIISYAIYLAAALWLVFEEEFSSFLVGRILLGFGSGAAETLAPITIADVFFLHERGKVMAFYTSFLSIGVAFGILIDGLIVIDNGWRIIYATASALVGFVFLLALFTFPETAFVRDGQSLSEVNTPGKTEAGKPNVATQQSAPAPKKRSYLQSLKIFRGVLTEESLVKMFFRPIGVIVLPSVLWASLVQSVTIGFVVAVTSNVAVAYSDAYDFDAWQVGLAFISAIIGSLAGIPAGGRLGDLVADWFTKRNGGIRTPEMRLPAMAISLVTTPLALILYGVGIENELHWICPTIGLGLLNFSITQATNICLVYVIDAYRPITGEITLTVLGFKSLFGFLLSFYTNPWVEEVGYLNAYGTMAAISAAILLLWIPLYFWGNSLRHRTWQWKPISYIHWTSDREVGEMWFAKSPRNRPAVDDSEDSEDCEDCHEPFLELEKADEKTFRIPRGSGRLAKYMTCSTLWGSTILATLLLTSIALSIAKSLWGIEDDPDYIFADWGKPGTGTGSLAWYPTDFLRDVIPVPCHSHNDYWRKVPLLSALHAGCTGVEADVWLFDNDSELYVGHDKAALTPHRTFQSLYVNPLVEILAKNNPRTSFYNGTRRGVFDTDPDQTLVLLVDLKTDGAKTFAQVEAQLEPLRARNWLTYVKDGVVHERQITVVGTGLTPFATLVQNSTYRDIFFDAPLDEFYEDPNIADAHGNNGPFVYNNTNSFYASVNFKQAVGSVWTHLDDRQLGLIRGQIKGAHKRGLKVRYWNTPAWPVGLRNRIWHTLVAEGVDILNADDLKAATRKRCGFPGRFAGSEWSVPLSPFNPAIRAGLYLTPPQLALSTLPTRSIPSLLADPGVIGCIPEFNPLQHLAFFSHIARHPVLSTGRSTQTMSTNTALVTGATGLLGRQVLRAFERADWNVKGTGHSRADGSTVLKVDLAKPNEVEAMLGNVGPNVVVHCAANRFPDKCDKDPEGTRALNVTAAESLASLCAARNTLLIYISTDYVFPGKPGDAPYAADATPQPTNLYGQTKLDGEHAVSRVFERENKTGLGIILRVPVLYGDAEVPAESAVNVLMESVWKAQEPGSRIKMDHWALRYPTNTEDVGRVCYDVATKYLDAQDRSALPRILQFSSEDKFTKYEICQAFGEIMGLPITGIEPNTEGNDPNAAVQRPYDCHLSTAALKQIGIDVSTQDFVGWWRWHVRAFRK
ncbi:hypothetical protein NUW58_g1529 [Xylaria curta]|uniref:Uncharacterized protein n=1 Tax=Xylaria curta TaxID=42375 RepID=A0ACC1PKR7_9PEZI|nr:hypothetical protein NUW58_g1529 [Xylaria curta]